MREAIGMTLLDLGPHLDIILGGDWTFSRDLRFLDPQGRVTGGGPLGPLATPLRPAAPSAVHASVMISHCEFRRMLRRGQPEFLRGRPYSRPHPLAAIVACRKRGTR